jgi:osmoprotectant transport system ATP-binding protein|tara:strand:- start:341 stop:1057 length:717 start_codon:yes stop_codon:yes gene_type:complete
LIEFRDVTKTYGHDLAVTNFSLSAPSGKITVLMGLSGSGKTTLLRTVNKLVQPTSGTILIDGNDIADLDSVVLRRSIGYVMQEVGLLPHKSVLDNVTLIAQIAGQNKDEALRNALELLELVGIGSSFHDRFPGQLSGGQQQRVGVARALAIRPNILLMDEPFGAVDPIVREELQDELIRIQRQLSLTIILVTHDRYEAIKLADQLVVLSQGAKIEQVGTPKELTEKPANKFVQKLLGL